jgi:hypothetical protein
MKIIKAATLAIMLSASAFAYGANAQIPPGDVGCPEAGTGYAIQPPASTDSEACKTDWDVMHTACGLALDASGTSAICKACESETQNYPFCPPAP